MPGTHLTSQIYSSWSDVGGCDLWVGMWYTKTQRWYEGWYSPKPLELWFLTQPNSWNLIGWELWREGPGLSPELLEVQYVWPNPGRTTKQQWFALSKQPKWLEKNTYKDHEVATTEWLDAVDALWLMGEEKGGFLGKGAPKTADSKGKGHESKGTGAPKTGGGKGKGPESKGTGAPKTGGSKGKGSKSEAPRDGQTCGYQSCVFRARAQARPKSKD